MHCVEMMDFHSEQKNKLIGMSKRSYMEAVVEGLKSINSVDVAFMPHDVDTHSPLNSLSIDNNCNVTPRKRIYVRLLLSIDRRETTEDAMETVCWQLKLDLKFAPLIMDGMFTFFLHCSLQVKLALELKDVGVVGIDLSGNPIVGEWYVPKAICCKIILYKL